MLSSRADKIAAVGEPGINRWRWLRLPHAAPGKFLHRRAAASGATGRQPAAEHHDKSTNFSALFRPKYNLEVGAFYRKENDELISSSQNYRLWEIRTRYNIGKISIEGGFGNIHNMLDQANSVSGLNINRYWFRIRRTFNFF